MQPDELAARVSGPGAAVDERIFGENGNRVAVESSEPGDDRAAPVRTDLEEAVPVEHRVHDAAHLVNLARLARHDRRERLFAPLRIVVGHDLRGMLVDVRSAGTTRTAWPARRPQPRSRPRRRWRRCVCGCRRGRVPLCHVAELRLLDEGRTGDHHLGGVAHDQRVVRRATRARRRCPRPTRGRATPTGRRRGGRRPFPNPEPRGCRCGPPSRSS